MSSDTLLEPTDRPKTHGWRIVLLTVAPAMAHGLTHFLRARNHEVVGLVLPAGVHGPRPRDAEGWLALQRLLEAAPPSLDVLLASERSHLTPLIAALKPDLLLCCFYPWRIPAEALALAPLGAVNGHPSLLPRYRGPNPLGWTLRDDAPELGMSFHRMDANFDTGPLLDQARAPIEDGDTSEALFARLVELCAMMLPQVLERIAWGDAGEPQAAEGASYAPFFEQAYREVDWREPARAVHLRVRACDMGGWGGKEGHALATLEGVRVKLRRSRLLEPSAPSSAALPGAVLERQDGELLVQCGDGPLWVWPE